ncbi:Tetraacyldisaccharide 4'-kinase [Roseimaritima multifibrata]|uniref:Tetraacyldisaccharide 4'-kinase n=1 Tax=Roseimaritima multifibrata TaxID=1930274 RepID=A0A517M909_9BACT|nr:tetraacyldisaccharide 4'-kinase [Roseimaritima multifibrata]QDS91373.1 Tetraacyldisaccharide 4'-kinase [Roseimaritima multifibrata]
MDYRSLMNGQRRDPLAFVLRPLLRIGSWFYGLGIRIRNSRYDRGVSETHDAGVPVISVGNLTTGGTGKTPLVCYLARELRSQGFRVALISRGYGRGDGDLNDEALELELRLPDVPHVQDPDRVAAAAVAVEELETEILLMDDGFQHRRLQRDLDIVVIDATCPFGYGYLLPRGMLREPIASIRRADVAILSRCNHISPEERLQIKQAYLRRKPDLIWLEAEHHPGRLVDHENRPEPLEVVAGKRVLVFCGIGNPAAFAKTVRDCGAELVDQLSLPDHASYDREMLERLRAWGESWPPGEIEYMLCTQKDLVKIRTNRIAGIPLRAIQIDMTVEPEAELQQALKKVVQPDGPVEGTV